MKADILIQAGHEGRTSGATGASGPLGREIDWTPIISDEATRLLREAGYSVIRETADGNIQAEVAIAVSVHFDGNNSPCASGTSFGYDDSTDKPVVDILRAAYLPHVPAFVNRMRDNFTPALKGYYGFRDWKTSKSEFVFEVCEISCPEQAAWAKPRLLWIAAVLAHALDKAMGNSRIPHPGPSDAPPPVVVAPTPEPGPTFEDLDVLASEVKALAASLDELRTHVLEVFTDMADALR